MAILAPGSAERQPIAKVFGSAINQDGRSSGLTAPNGPSQTALIKEAMSLANLPSGPSDISFVAVHGTGTPLGDPIEVGALGQALARSENSAILGSVKACYGHTEGAAGLTGLSHFPSNYTSFLTFQTMSKIALVSRETTSLF